MKTRIFEGMKVRIDRPKGFVQKGVGDDGKPWERTYQYDYGFLPKTAGGDGEGLDVYLGPNENAHDAFWVIQKNGEGKFDEYKVFLGFASKAAAKKAYLAHCPAKYFGGMATMTVQMMRSMLGHDPLEKVATGFFFEAAQLLV